MRRLLKLAHSLPYNLEAPMKAKFGITLASYVPNKYILFYKETPDKVGDNVIVLPGPKNKPTELTRKEKIALERRCTNIVDMFTDPYSMIGPIRTRLTNIASTLSDLEREFIQEFMDENFPVG